MSIKYNEFGEVISVNGITTGQHLGTPMQDAIGTEEENSAYGTELATVGRLENVVEDAQPTTQGGEGTNEDGGSAINVLYYKDMYDHVNEIVLPNGKVLKEYMEFVYGLFHDKECTKPVFKSELLKMIGTVIYVGSKGSTSPSILATQTAWVDLEYSDGTTGGSTGLIASVWVNMNNAFCKHTFFSFPDPVE